MYIDRDRQRDIFDRIRQGNFALCESGGCGGESGCGFPSWVSRRRKRRESVGIAFLQSGEEESEDLGKRLGGGDEEENGVDGVFEEEGEACVAGWVEGAEFTFGWHFEGWFIGLCCVVLYIWIGLD